MRRSALPLVLLTACLPDVPTVDPGTGPGASPGVDAPGVGTASFSCTTSAKPKATPLRRLLRGQYEHALSELLATLPATHRDAILADINPALGLVPPDDGGNTFGARHRFDQLDTRVSAQHVQGYHVVARLLAQRLTAAEHRDALLSAYCTTPSANDCPDQVIAGFGRIAYRRALDASELASLRADYDGVAGGGYREVILRILSSPNFLYRVEVRGEAKGADALALTPNEIVTRLALHFWQSIPDAALLDAVADKTSLSDAEYASLVDRVFADARTRQTIASFYDQWLGLDRMPVFQVGNPEFDAFASGVDLTTFAADIREEARALTASATWEKNQSLSSLLPILTTPAMLVSGSTQTSPIKRGVFVLREVLCDQLPSPPSDLQNQIHPPMFDPQKTTRQRFEALTAAPSCAGCHAVINPYGFALEDFDALGRHRTTESIFDDTGALVAQLPIDATADVALASDDKTHISGGVDLTRKIAESGRADTCFVRQYFRFATGRDEDDVADGCSMQALYEELTKNGGSLAAAMKAVALRPEFRVHTL